MATYAGKHQTEFFSIFTSIHDVGTIQIHAMYGTVPSFRTEGTVVYVSANFDSLSISLHKHK